MPLATITSKGQVTIPKPIRDQLKLEAGDQIDFVAGDDGTVTMRRRALRVRDVFGAFAHRARGSVSVEAMDAAVDEQAASEPAS